MIQLPTLNSDNVLSLLHLMPVGIFLVNSDNRIIWVNKTLCEQVGLEARQLIGHMRSELPGTNIFPISERIARQHINSPSNETLFNFNYLSKTLETEFDDIAEIGCLVKFKDLSDNQIQFGFEQVEEQTGLYTRHGILKKLSLHVSRSRRYFNPLSVIMLRVAPDSEVNNESINHAIAMILRDKLRWVDDVGHWNMSDFLLILPETGEEAANKLARKIKFQLNRFKLPENHKKIPTSIAVSSWRKGEDESNLLKRVSEQLNENRYKVPSASKIS
ncbi:MAG: diguanylate cyclase [Proteobacteria bacterium]|nr:diguanylate cyclase [Pseudomonadota bacterium]NOG61076.1 diguanylate cyclase [Pseudomonadota bacterium]